jgi:transcriptional regulator of acetoin/glycerol metabolism
MGSTLAFSWPGNIRQLKQAIESLSHRCTSNQISENDIYRVLPELAGLKLSSSGLRSGAYSSYIMLQERQRYERAIIKANGNRSEAAKLLSISRATFFRRAKELGLVKQTQGTI